MFSACSCPHIFIFSVKVRFLSPFRRLSNIKIVAVDLRALRREFDSGLRDILADELSKLFSTHLSSEEVDLLHSSLVATGQRTLDRTSTMDAVDQMKELTASFTPILVEAFTCTRVINDALSAIPRFRQNVAARASSLLDGLRKSYLSGERGAAPASSLLGKTRAVYEYIRISLGVRMHGAENYRRFPNGLGVDDQTIGQNISIIYEVSFVVVIEAGYSLRSRLYAMVNFRTWSRIFSRLCLVANFDEYRIYPALHLCITSSMT